MIELRALSKIYKIAGQEIKAVQKVNLTVDDGEFMSIVGHSGSGKSTLLSLMGCLTRPDMGSVLIDGEDIWSRNDYELSKLRNEKIGFVYQFPSLIPTLTAAENVFLPTVFGKKRSIGDAVKLLELVGLYDKTERYPSELSSGEQQRVAIARAFINSPKFILADEPTGNIDEETESEIMAFFERMNKGKNTTIIMATHDVNLLPHATRKFRMKNGILYGIS